jgi:PPP family 3-phenylpropionic acid transporter
MAPAWRLRLLYFLYYGAVGALLPYFAPYLLGLGFSGAAIGTVQMLGPLAALVVPIWWTARADRTGSPEGALRQAATLACLAACLLPLARTPLAVGAVVLLQALGDRAVVPLLDTLTLDHVHRTPGATYARIRLAGSVGFAGLALAGGAALAWRGNRPGDLLVPVAAAALVTGYAVAARRLPHAEPLRGPRPGWRDLLALLGQPRLRGLLLVCAVHWLSCAPFHLLFGVLVRERGLPSTVTGLGMATGVAAEVAALLWFPRLARRFSLRALLTAAFAATAARWLILSQAEGALAVVTLQAIHGLTFGLFWGGAVEGLSRLVPPAQRASGQGLFSAIVFGGGNALGFLLSGLAFDSFGSVAPVFAAAGMIEFLPTAGALVVLREPAPGVKAGIR